MISRFVCRIKKALIYNAHKQRKIIAFSVHGFFGVVFLLVLFFVCFVLVLFSFFFFFFPEFPKCSLAAIYPYWITFYIRFMG